MSQTRTVSHTKLPGACRVSVRWVCLSATRGQALFAVVLRPSAAGSDTFSWPAPAWLDFRDNLSQGIVRGPGPPVHEVPEDFCCWCSGSSVPKERRRRELLPTLRCTLPVHFLAGSWSHTQFSKNPPPLHQAESKRKAVRCSQLS